MGETEIIELHLTGVMTMDVPDELRRSIRWLEKRCKGIVRPVNVDETIFLIDRSTADDYITTTIINNGWGHMIDPALGRDDG